MPKFTIEQQLAIDVEGKNVLVSAGAGSGKTAVLTERVLRKIKEGTHINELLILTFTNKAALEMKERIRKKLQDASITSELELVDSSYVTTFDAYSLALVRKYADVLHLSNDINIAEDSVLKLKKKKILDEVFLEYYDNPNSGFKELVTNFCLKDDKDLKTKILLLDEKLELELDKEKFINNYIDRYYNEEKISGYLDSYLNLLKEKKKEILEFYYQLREVVEGKYLEELEILFKEFVDSDTYLEFKNTLPLRLPTVRKGSSEDAKPIKEKLRKALKSFSELLVYEDIDSITSSIYSTKDTIEIILEIIKKLNIKFNSYKRENNFYTFMDIEKLAISLVRDNLEIREEVKNSFKEILIDEYQDTNDIQEAFISYISNNNVYMVGDIKQSIYRFRNANPSIFKNKYDNYKKNNGGMAIDLSKNFRSREEVITDINLFFSHIMDDDLGGANYNNGHAMIFGNTTYLTKAKVDHDNFMEVYTYSDTDDDYTKVEKEAFIVANDIKSKINSNYSIYDKDLDVLRQIEYKDFVILLDRATDFTIYKQIFEYLSIPITLYEDEKTSGSIDLLLLKNMFIMADKIINKEYDVKFKMAFTSIARSFLFEYNDDLIYKYLSNDTYKDSSIYKVFDSVLSNYEVLSPSLYLMKILEALNYEDMLIKVGNVDIFKGRMEYFYNLITNLEKSGYTIIDVSNYLSEIATEKLEIKLSISKNDSNSVKIMTIHKSKGLEYPVCYFAGFYKEFNKDEFKASVLFNNKYGIVIPDFLTGNNLITKTLMLEELKKEDISEKIRLLYVALTRAREKMIIVMPSTDEEIELFDIVDNLTRLSYSNFAKMVTSVLSLFANKIRQIEKIDNITKKYLEVKEIDNLGKTGNTINVIKSNYQEGIVTKEVLHKEELKVKTDDELKLLEFGNLVHNIFERIDFINNKTPMISDLYLKKKVESFINSEFINKYRNYKKYKEYEFISRNGSKKTHGKIDLLLVGDEDFIIIDYKLKNIMDDAYIKQVIGYMEIIEEKINKKGSCYLYSIIDEMFVKMC